MAGSSATKTHTAAKSGKSPQLDQGIKLRKLELRNFKLFDHFEIEFPEPRMSEDPDVFVLGSENGLGKTTILEACVALFASALAKEREMEILQRWQYELPLDPLDILVKAGAIRASIEGILDVDTKETKTTLNLSRKGRINREGDTTTLRKAIDNNWKQLIQNETLLNFLAMLSTPDPEPFLAPPIVYFHSYRKVQEGSPELGMLVEAQSMGPSGPSGPYPRPRYPRRSSRPISAFKVEILRSMMSRGDLFEELDRANAETDFDALNRLVSQYAGGRIEKLRPSADNTIEFRVTPNSGGPSYSFDGLSSGQKEVISTLFLIWKYTREQPGIILIDEPELHLNAEWHRSFVRRLHELAPQNQYILATHSEDVFESVPPERRAILHRGE